MAVLRITLVALLLAGAAGTAAAQKVERLFYTIDNEKCFESFRENIGSIDIVGPQSYKFDAHGILWGSVDKRMLGLAARHNVKVMPLLVNAGFDQPAFHALLVDSSAKARAVAAMVRICREHKFYGLQFDFENIHVRDRDAFTEFYRQAAHALHAAGFAISIAVVPRVSENTGPTEYHKWIYEFWRGAYDYKALGEIGDFISLMTYDQHTHRTTPGPVAGLRWMEAVIRFVLPMVPASKISIGIPFYSYRWQPSYQNGQAHVWGRSLDYAEAIGLADRHGARWQWDDQDKVSFTYYPNEYINEFLFIEDARSFAAKYELVTKYGFRGISVWRLGHEDPRIWKQLRDGSNR
jgi:spore germination protein YaaH